MSDGPTDPREAAGPWALAWGLAVGQTVSWGVLYYTFAVMQEPLQAATGWSRTLLNGGASFGLLVWGLCAPLVGRLIQRGGGREVLLGGTLAGTAALLLMALVLHPVAYLAAWGLLGAAMAGVLYEPAFAVLTAAFGPDSRRAILLVTLVAGFASTIFLPLAHQVVTLWGWQRAWVGLAVAQALVGLPLYGSLVPRRLRPRVATPGRDAVAGSRATPAWVDPGDRRLVGLMVWFGASSLGFAGFIYVLVPMLGAEGIPPDRLLSALMLIGPLQVAGRLLLAGRLTRMPAVCLAPWAHAVLALGLGFLLAWPGDPAALWGFGICFGLGNGVLTVLRATAVAELLGAERYAELNGLLTLPTMLAKAASPLVLAAVWTGGGGSAGVYGFGLVSLAAATWGAVLARRAAAGPGFPRPVAA